MQESNVLVELLKIIGLVLLIVFLVPLIIAAVAYVGYFFGLIVAFLASGVLSTTGITENNIPVVIAWLFVASSIIGVSNATGTKEDA